MTAVGYLGTSWENRCWVQRSASQFDSPSLRRVYLSDFTSGFVLSNWVVCGVRASCALTGSATRPVATTRWRHEYVTYQVVFARNTPKGRTAKPRVVQPRRGLCQRQPRAGSLLHTGSSGGEPEHGVTWQHHAAACENTRMLFLTRPFTLESK